MPDTIVALSTPLGRSGIGVVRLSGPGSLKIAASICSDGYKPEPRTAVLRTLKDSAGDPIDEAVLTYFKGPNSFTGEDIVEISCHGSPVLLRQVIDICLSMDARMADAGEFSLRALANGRMDLAEAEAIRDLIDAQTTAAARQAVRQMGGEFSKQLTPLKDDLLNVIVVLESALEFVEDDLPEVQAEVQQLDADNVIENNERKGVFYEKGGASDMGGVFYEGFLTVTGNTIRRNNLEGVKQANGTVAVEAMMDVKRVAEAVVFMANKSGASFKEPAAKAGK